MLLIMNMDNGEVIGKVNCTSEQLDNYCTNVMEREDWTYEDLYIRVIDLDEVKSVGLDELEL